MLRAAHVLRSAQWSECGSHLCGEELRLFPGGEVPAALGLVEVGDVRVPRLDPAARALPDLSGNVVKPTGSETGGGAWPLAAACAAACPFSQYDRAAEAPVPVSQYSVMLSRMWSCVGFPDGSPSTKAWNL